MVHFFVTPSAKYGVSVECLLMSTRASTGMAIILLEDNGENRILVDKGANDDLKIADLEVILAPDKYSAVLLQLRSHYKRCLTSFVESQNGIASDRRCWTGDQL